MSCWLKTFTNVELIEIIKVKGKGFVFSCSPLTFNSSSPLAIETLARGIDLTEKSSSYPVDFLVVVVAVLVEIGVVLQLLPIV
jgi:hypothetical protein